jgi:hypothetical protein
VVIDDLVSVADKKYDRVIQMTLVQMLHSIDHLCCNHAEVAAVLFDVLALIRQTENVK